MFTISYIIFHHQLFGFHKKEKCLDDYLLSFNVDVCIIPTCTTALIDAKLITQPLLLKLFSCYFRFLFKFAFLFVFKNQRLRWCYKPLPPIILPKISKATFFKVFPCCKSMIAKKANKSNKDQSSLFDHPAIGLIWPFSTTWWNEMSPFLKPKDLWFHWKTLAIIN